MIIDKYKLNKPQFCFMAGTTGTKGEGGKGSSTDPEKEKIDGLEVAGAVLGGLGAGAEGFMKNNQIADTTGIENSLNSLKNTTTAAKDYSSLMQDWSNLAKPDYIGFNDVRGLSSGEGVMNALNASVGAFGSGMQTGNPWVAAGMATGALGAGIAGIFTGNKKARKKQKELNNQADLAWTNANSNMQNQAGNIMINNALGMQANDVLAEGGPLFTQGGRWDTGLTYVNNGGTHEENPNGGVQMGVDPQGVPNLVEEGETIWNDYVFSNRLKVPKAELKILGAKEGDTYADVSKKMAKGITDNPNDVIEKRGFEANMNKLQQSQEALKARQEERKQQREQRINAEDEAMLQQALAEQQGMPVEESVAEEYPQEEIPQDMGQEELGLNPQVMAGYAKGGHLFKRGGYNFNGAAWNGNYSKWNPIRKRKARSYWSEYALDPKSIYDAEGEFTEDFLRKYWGNRYDANNKEEQGEGALRRIGITPKEAANYKNKVKQIQNTTDPDLKKAMGNPSLTTTPALNTKGRYAPIVSNLVNLGMSLRPNDYSNINTMVNASRKAGTYDRIAYQPNGTYMQYKPFDRNYWMTSLNNQANAARETAIGISNGNSQNYMAGLSALMHNYYKGASDMAVQGDKYNLDLKQKVLANNNAVDKNIADGILKANMANQGIRERAQSTELQGMLTSMSAREAMDQGRNNAIAGNIDQLGTNFGNIGRENFAMNQVNSDGSLYDGVSKDGYRFHKNSKGGLLTVKKYKKGGFKYGKL